MKISRIDDGKQIVVNARHAKRFIERLIGLLGRKTIPPGEGMLFDPGGSIHTFGMRFSIDVVFLDKNGTILNKKQCLLPYRICFAPLKTRYVLECPVDTISSNQLEKGQQLRWSND